MRNLHRSARHITLLLCLVASATTLTGCPSEIAARLNYSIDIDRHFNTPLEEDLILVAENTYPDPEDVAQLYPSGTDPNDLPENVWWYYPYYDSEMRYPYAITADAIEYYKQKIREDRAHAVPRPDLWDWYSESFKYTATIEYFPTFEGEDSQTFTDVYVVTMRLGWSVSCGPLCGGGFYQDRKVILTPNGEVLQVQGDGQVGQIYS